jgi:hypothetical protein
MRGDEEQPFVDEWPMFEEAHSKFPVLANVEAARLRLARKFNQRLPKDVEIELAWRAHSRSTHLLRG